MVDDALLQEKYETLFSHLDERSRRLVAAADAERLGRGGVSLVSRASGLSRPTINKGRRELSEAPLEPGRTRKMGGGRKRVEENSPDLLQSLESLIAPATRGDPESPLRWTSLSTRHLAEALERDGHTVSHRTVAQLLHSLEYSLQGTAKTIEGNQHPDRDAQFKYIARTTKRHFRQGWPVISVDTKKKELVGPFKQGGREWRPKGDPERVRVHDFIDRELGKAIPYGVYDVGRDEGWVSVGVDHDTSTFAVATIEKWWKTMGKPIYCDAPSLLICADGGGSNGSRTRLWKAELQGLATRTGLRVTICHFPPGTSKWNKIEHRLFSHITMNWRGRPLVSHDVVVRLIGSTKTGSGGRVRAKLDKRKYPTGVRVTDAEVAALQVEPHKFHGEWNYSIKPQL